VKQAASFFKTFEWQEGVKEREKKRRDMRKESELSLERCKEAHDLH